MKKILVFILCAMLMIALPVVASAEETEAPTVEESAPVEENVPTTEEVATEGKNEPSMTEDIVNYVKSHIEELTVIASTIALAFYTAISKGGLKGSIGTLNNNAISIAENSAKTIKDALEEVVEIGNIVKSYKEEFEILLEEVRKNAEEKQSLEETIGQVTSFLKTAKMANLELSKELAELLLLANIPNSVKDELTARHMKAVRELEAAEEVMNSDGKEA